MGHKEKCRNESCPLKRTIMIFLSTAMVFLILTGCAGQQAKETQTLDAMSEEMEDGADAGQISSETPDSGATADSVGSVDEEADAKESEETGDVPQTVTLVMVGDILLHDPIEEAAKRDDENYDFDAIFKNTADIISGADLALVNQEVIIGGEELGVSGYPAFNAPYAIGDSLYDAGFDVVLHATNHALDRGANGIDNCLDYWKSRHPDMEVLGIYKDADDRDDLCVMEVNGIRIAILNYTYGTNGIDLPSGRPYAVNLMDDAHRDQIAGDLSRACEESDFVIVCPHWGIEYELEPSYSQQEWASFFADNGADLIIGTHPHVIEPIEMIEDEVEGDETLCYYSLGNFVNWTSGTGEGVANRMVGGMAEVTIEKDENGDAFICDHGVKALVAHLTDGEDGVTVYPLAEYNEKMSYDNRIRLQDPAFSYEYCVDLCDRVWGDDWE